MTVEIHRHDADLSGVRLHYLTAGAGDPVVLLHGVPQSSHEWRRIIPHVAAKHAIIAPDLRGLGDSSRPATGYDKKTVAADIWELVGTRLGVPRFHLVGHDWGGPVAFALAAHHPEAVRSLTILDVTVPGDGMEMSQGGRRWHHPFFRTLDLPEALLAGREHIFLEWLFDTYGHRPGALPAEDRAEYLRTYAKPGGLRALLAYYRAFPTDAADNAALVAERGKLRMPVLALGGDRAFGRGMETYESMTRLAENVRGGLIPECGHWVAEEAPEFLAEQLLGFFAECR
ncbi:alpha/beta fold hydrolase [Methylobacterium sp. NEAU 140]|uniref:alpha/beta fold hydrolase n=1 Tax=Methylobacterium sp. NEAU 140 TaxID=3064945 RepID=UPI002735DCDD|nr:alpha/beta fold hydrolase [Methylobacterium sp. NEAU 140]MDP4026574.1 alpha/beta fold hydrolase [Methylobacterium sp. NEAU 140]